jgi:ribosomal protein S18 acetylase RimI-like enzyme
VDNGKIAILGPEPGDVSALADILMECVARGDSVSFLHPLDRAIAVNFWERWLASSDRVVFGARLGGVIVSTVTLLLGMPQNQPHRAEIAKVMTRPAYRGRGIATRLMRAAEAEAVHRGKLLMTLDTAADGGAGPFYERMGFHKIGTIPDYALKPHGGLTGATFYWKRIAS